ncbi:MAG: NAD(P)H-dependent glycerol-3-phosphate dehydrogenase [Clostridia bacterium]|nr:NAD(P)H-dependent glycerol-3-phosphate dehydrogenase [Clostridia bacterium]
MKIAFIGAGSWGTALSIAAADNHHEIKIWDIDPSHIEAMQKTRRNDKYLGGVRLKDNIEPTTDIQDCLKNADVLIIAVASQAFRLVMEAHQAYIEKKTIIVNVAKGIENKTLKRISEISEEFKPENPFVVLSGPSHAEEVSHHLPTTLVSASKSKEAAEIVQDLFSTDYLRVYTNPDVVGVELGGALKNIIALAAGITDGMGYGDNAKAALMTRGIREITRLGVALGAKVETFTGLSGVGDLIVTCTSMHSRNRRCGIMIGEGMSRDDAEKKVGMVVEGIYATQAAYDLSKKLNIEMPIVEQLYQVLYQGYDAKAAVKNLMGRKRKHEMEEVTQSESWE